MTSAERREAVRQFINRWRGKGNEKQHSRSYWIELFTDVVGADNPTQRIEFEKDVIVDGRTKNIDVYVPETRVLIEQKSIGIDLSKKEKQSDGAMLTPYEQGKRYNDNLPLSEKARWIITSNFAEIWIYDMEARIPEPFKLTLTDLQNKYTKLDLLVEEEVEKLTDEMRVSIDAGKLVGQIYDAFAKEFGDMTIEANQKALNVLCVRLVFCLYAEDADNVFQRKEQFRDYLAHYQARDMRMALINLFKVLNTPKEQRDPFLEKELAEFPYVNGGLFDDENPVIPPITDEIRDLLINKASDDFDWSDISPTIFGAVFESTLNPETRRKGGMHYTSIENIMKIISPLFLDDLEKEFEEIKAVSQPKRRIQKLDAFQDKLAGLKFLDIKTPKLIQFNYSTAAYLQAG